MHSLENTPSEEIAIWRDAFEKHPAIQSSRFFYGRSESLGNQVNLGFRNFAADLFSRDLIGIADYTSILGGNAINCLTIDESGLFRDMKTGADASILVEIYSRAKYGGASDIRYLARVLIKYLSEELDSSCSHWSDLFKNAKNCGDNVVMMTTGWRNVPSTANIIFEIVVEEINVKLAHMGLPTIINVKLPRIAPPCENYAALSVEERQHVNLIQDHVIPAENFYRWSGVHVIFGDDILVTGATADKVLFESMKNGAKSFRAIYPVALDPRITLNDASVEERLNRVAVGQNLDKIFADLLSDPGYKPILRTLRLLFGENNRDDLANFLPKVPAMTWLRLYKSALGNEFLGQAQCAPSLKILKAHLIKLNLLNANDMTVL